MKDLVDDVPKKLLAIYFNLWRKKLPKVDDEEVLKRTTKKTIVKRRIVNLQKKTKDEPETEEPKDLNLNIPSSPVETTLNPIKGIRPRVVKQYEPEDVDSLPPKEPRLRTRVPERRIYPEIYDEIQKTKKELDFQLDFLKQVPHPTFNKLMPKKILI